MKAFLKALEHPQWHRFGFPVDFESNRMFYAQPLFYPFFDFYLVEELGFSKPSYPKGRFAVCVTFDLDRFDLRREAFRQSTRALRRANLRGLLASLRWFYQATGFTDLEAYLNLLSQFKIPATFFLAPHPGEDPRDPMYTLTDHVLFKEKQVPISEMARFLQAHGHEVGLHPPVDTYNTPKMLRGYKEQAESILGFPIVSIRQHWLMFDPEKTPRVQSEVGFLFDSTYGFNRMPGFRAGTSYPFYFDDTSPLEIPLLLQEGALLRDLRSGSMGLSLSKAIELGKHLLRQVAKVGGIAVILVHPARLGPDSKLRQRWMTALLEETQALEAQFMTIREAGEYWQRHYEALHRQAIQNIRFEDILRFWGQKCAEFMEL